MENKYVIHKPHTALYWSKERSNWVLREKATLFTEEERRHILLPAAWTSAVWVLTLPEEIT